MDKDKKKKTAYVRKATVVKKDVKEEVIERQATIEPVIEIININASDVDALKQVLQCKRNGKQYNIIGNESEKYQLKRLIRRA